MPYLQIFTIGEMARRGVSGKREKGFFRTLFLVLFSIAQYSIFAPLYWYWMLMQACGYPLCDDTVKSFDIDLALDVESLEGAESSEENTGNTDTDNITPAPSPTPSPTPSDPQL